MGTAAFEAPVDVDFQVAPEWVVDRSRAWAAALEATGTTHKRTRPYTPRTNGKVERFNGTLAREWAYVREYDSEAARRAALVDFLNHYNYHRPQGITDVELPKRPNEQLDLFDDE